MYMVYFHKPQDSNNKEFLLKSMLYLRCFLVTQKFRNLLFLYHHRQLRKYQRTLYLNLIIDYCFNKPLCNIFLECIMSIAISIYINQFIMTYSSKNSYFLALFFIWKAKSPSVQYSQIFKLIIYYNVYHYYNYFINLSKVLSKTNYMRMLQTFQKLNL